MKQALLCLVLPFSIVTFDVLTVMRLLYQRIQLAMKYCEVRCWLATKCHGYILKMGLTVLRLWEPALESNL